MIDDYHRKLMAMLSQERYNHSLGVQQTAEKLAKRYKVDVEKASVAGLIHDCAREMTGDELLRMAQKIDIEISDIYYLQPGLLHGQIGAYLAKDVFLIDDQEILHAIKYHTTGCRDMSLLDKIIYIADYIEPGRDFKGVDELRKAAEEDIDKGVLLALDNTIIYVISKNQLIDVNTIDARNYLLKNVFKTSKEC